MTKIIKDIQKELFEKQDKKYKDFNSKLIPTVDSKCFIGVRTPELRKLAKGLEKREDINDFLENLPHQYFEENQLHAFILSDYKDYEECISRVNVFLPHINNWATCDQMSPKAFKKNKNRLLKEIQLWLASKETYTIRFGIKMLMQLFLDEDFKKSYLNMVAKIRSDEYYVNMMVAWYFATALAKQYEEAIPYIEKHKLDDWTHNKTIQKAIESYQILPKQKEYLRTLKIK